jgi:hypothetical protein
VARRAGRGPLRPSSMRGSLSFSTSEEALSCRCATSSPARCRGG